MPLLIRGDPRGASQPHGAPKAAKGGNVSNATRRFQQERVLGYKEKLRDGFEAVFQPDERILVDARVDPALRGFVGFLSGCVPPGVQDSTEAATRAVSMVAGAVAAALGGRECEAHGPLEDRWRRRLDELRHSRAPGDSLPIGLFFGREVSGRNDLGAGLQHHRALLFKYSCDRLGICDCALVDGALVAKGAGVAGAAVELWPLALLGGQPLTVDCLSAPGEMEGAPALHSVAERDAAASADKARRSQGLALSGPGVGAASRRGISGVTGAGAASGYPEPKPGEGLQNAVSSTMPRASVPDTPGPTAMPYYSKTGGSSATWADPGIGFGTAPATLAPSMATYRTTGFGNTVAPPSVSRGSRTLEDPTLSSPPHSRQQSRASRGDAVGSLGAFGFQPGDLGVDPAGPAYAAGRRTASSLLAT